MGHSAWLFAAPNLTLKPWNIVSAVANMELGAPVTILRDVVRDGSSAVRKVDHGGYRTEAAALIVIGFTGLSVHCAVGSAPASQVATT